MLLYLLIGAVIGVAVGAALALAIYIPIRKRSLKRRIRDSFVGIAYSLVFFDKSIFLRL